MSDSCQLHSALSLTLYKASKAQHVDILSLGNTQLVLSTLSGVLKLSDKQDQPGIFNLRKFPNCFTYLTTKTERERFTTNILSVPKTHTHQIWQG